MQPEWTKIGVKAVRHARPIGFRMVEVSKSRNRFAALRNGFAD